MRYVCYIRGEGLPKFDGRTPEVTQVTPKAKAKASAPKKYELRNAPITDTPLEVPQSIADRNMTRDMGEGANLMVADGRLDPENTSRLQAERNKRNKKKVETLKQAAAAATEDEGLKFTPGEFDNHDELTAEDPGLKFSPGEFDNFDDLTHELKIDSEEAGGMDRLTADNFTKVIEDMMPETSPLSFTDSDLEDAKPVAKTAKKPRTTGQAKFARKPKRARAKTNDTQGDIPVTEAEITTDASETVDMEINETTDGKVELVFDNGDEMPPVDMELSGPEAGLEDFKMPAEVKTSLQEAQSAAKGWMDSMASGWEKISGTTSRLLKKLSPGRHDENLGLFAPVVASKEIAAFMVSGYGSFFKDIWNGNNTNEIAEVKQAVVDRYQKLADSFNAANPSPDVSFDWSTPERTEQDKKGSASNEVKAIMETLAQEAATRATHERIEQALKEGQGIVRVATERHDAYLEELLDTYEEMQDELTTYEAKLLKNKDTSRASKKEVAKRQQLIENFKKTIDYVERLKNLEPDSEISDTEQEDAQLAA